MNADPDDRVPHPGPHHHCEDATALQRAFAWGLNVIVILAWIGFITGVRLFVVGDSAPPDGEATSKLIGHGIGLLTLTVPVWLYFSLMEWRFGYSLGKAALGLRVVDPTGHYPSLPLSMLRNALLLAPWEMAHAAMWWSLGTPFLDAPSDTTFLVLAAALALGLVWFVSTLVWPGRSLHDRLSGTKVVQVGVLRPET